MVMVVVALHRYDCQLDLTGGYQLFWSVTETQLRLCGVAPTNGWVGLGFSPNGLMIGSSAVIGRGFSDGTEDIQTYFLGSKNVAGVQPSPEFIIEDEFVVADMDNGEEDEHCESRGEEREGKERKKKRVVSGLPWFRRRHDEDLLQPPPVRRQL